MVKVHENETSGDVTFTEVPYSRSSLKTDDVFLVDTIAHIFIWCGKGATPTERKIGFTYAQEYLNQQQDRPKNLPVTKVMEGGENEEFNAHF
jgi:gelsolin